MSERPESTSDADVLNESSGVKLAVRIHRIKFLIMRYWWVVAAAIIIGMIVQGYRCTQLGPEYLSSSRMMVSGQININQSTVYSMDLINFFGTQVALMKSQATIDQAVARVRAMHPEVTIDDKARVDANQELKTSIFDLHVITNNPEYAPLLLDAVMDTYLAGKRGPQRANDGRSGFRHYVGNRAVGLADSKRRATGPGFSEREQCGFYRGAKQQRGNLSGWLEQ